MVIIIAVLMVLMVLAVPRIIRRKL